ncbi:MAG: histidine kinase [Treponema sp.]|nr:histidine kinase [Treponema sp.]
MQNIFFRKKIYGRTIISFLLTLFVCSLAIIFSIQNKMNIETLQMERLILESSYRLHEEISKKLYKTKALAALVIQGNGVVNNFQQIAAVITSDEPAIANVLLAPGGIVTDVYPREESKAVIGLDFFNDTYAGNKEAILARDTGELVMAGPFIVLQGFLGLVGRYPVYTEKNNFWGLVSVTLKFPDALENTGISMLEHHGFSYDLWRINPDTGEQQIIASGNRHSNANVSYVERLVTIHNANWYFRIFPLRSWYEHPETWFLIFAGLSISILISFLFQNNLELRKVKNDLLSANNILQSDAIANELELTKYKIAIMLSQIQPHFLYNALTAIAQLCDEDPVKAKKTIMDFSVYLRSNMESLNDKGLISIEKEISHVKGYLDLEKEIYKGALNVIYHIEAGGFMLPPLSIQPIAENAVRHGIGKKEGGGTITLTVRETDNDFLVTVADDGAGFNMDETQVFMHQDNQKHIGIQNVRRRIEGQCGGMLEISSKPEKGTIVVIKIPKTKS